MNKILLFIAAATVVIACSTQKDNADANSRWQINKPSKSLDVPTYDIRVEANSDTLIKLKNGTSIFIPSNCFVDAAGNVVTGSVDFSYKLYSSIADVILSGIPMEYDTAGQSSVFETAGMFEIQGESKGEAVYFAKGKEVTIGVPSDKEDPNFNFYSFKEGSNWKYENTLNPVNNKLKEEYKETLKKEIHKVVAPIKESVDVEAFDLDVTFNDFEELKVFQKLLWTMVPNHPSNDKSVLEKQWSGITLAKSEYNGAFNMILTSNADSACLLVQPVYSDADFKKAQEKFEKLSNRYDNELEARLSKDESYKSIGSFMRFARVNDFGIFNCDRFSRMEDAIVFEMDLTIPGGTKIKGDKQVFYLVENKKTVTNVPRSRLSNLKVNASSENIIITFLEDNKVAYFKNFPKDDSIEVHGEMTVVTNELATSDDFQKLLESI